MRWILLAVGAVVLATTQARAVDQKVIDAAVDRGVDGLKKMQHREGKWPHQSVGATALAGLTLLECGVSRTDKSVTLAAEAVRKEGLTLTETYSLSLAVLFLDRLNQVEDTPLIESMLVRLVGGQDRAGGWVYQCPGISQAETRRLSTEMGGRGQRGSRDLSKLPAKGKRTQADLPREIQTQLEGLGVGRPGGVGGVAGMMAELTGSDNSNTQFATLALWVGRRYGVPTQGALLRVEERFRKSQLADGGWSYLIQPNRTVRLMAGGVLNSRAPMTCAGLLGLACGHGARVDVKAAKDGKTSTADISKDINLKAGLKAVAEAVGRPVGWDGRAPRPATIPTARATAYYFLWSLERVAVILGLDTIDRKDWFTWGVEVLLANQMPDGRWAGHYGVSGADTCFALLFLKKVDLAHDLTARLRGGKGLGGRALRSGGVGGGALTGNKPPKTGLESVGIGAKGTDKNPETARPGTAEEEAATRLSRTLLLSKGQARAKALKELRDTRGSAYTEALAGAIPALDAEGKQQAREALADRLTRMKADVLREYLKNDNAEIRRAAALATGQKDAKVLVPDLIRLLDDPEAQVQRAAHAALREMAGKDFGPRTGASESERKKAVAAWQAWWKKQARE
jgi:hypothetical protein